LAHSSGSPALAQVGPTGQSRQLLNGKTLSTTRCRVFSVAVASQSLDSRSQRGRAVDSRCCQEHFHEGEAALCLQGIQSWWNTLQQLRPALISRSATVGQRNYPSRHNPATHHLSAAVRTGRCADSESTLSTDRQPLCRRPRHAQSRVTRSPSAPCNSRTREHRSPINHLKWAWCLQVTLYSTQGHRACPARTPSEFNNDRSDLAVQRVASISRRGQQSARIPNEISNSGQVSWSTGP
jgi:hypothetical protein